MQIEGKPVRVKLIKDLTRYDKRLTAGQLGTTIPNVKLSFWGNMDTFVAVEFDCCVQMDIAYKSIEKVVDGT